MNENTSKISRQKACAVRKWEEISKFGGEAPSPAEISECIKRERSTRLSREEVQRRVYQYLTSCMEKYEDEDTHETGYRWRKNPTKAGLAPYLRARLSQADILPLMDSISAGVKPAEAISKFVHGIAFNTWNFCKKPEKIYLSGGFCNNKCMLGSKQIERNI